ncbi:MAG: 5-formyltetrahydrofolate cyclo-ligase [Deltaproteobacteria bacterium]|nr:5-formyltetrahydrofolate cyclo-ligase [Deltaproteobacteria bacterium]
MKPPPAATLADQKRRMRKTHRDFRRSLDEHARDARSRLICDRIRALPEWSCAATVGLYQSLAGEVDLSALLVAAGAKALVWPVVVQRGAPLEYREGPPTVRGPYGILEPRADARLVPLYELDLVVVPGLAFDAMGGRLGQGGGFYDRTLLHTDAIRVGVCFRDQMVPSVPVGAQDSSMDIVVLEDRMIRAARGRA